MDFELLFAKEQKLGYTDSAVFGGFAAYIGGRAQLNGQTELAQLATAYSEAALAQRPELLRKMRLSVGLPADSEVLAPPDASAAPETSAAPAAAVVTAANQTTEVQPKKPYGGIAPSLQLPIQHIKNVGSQKAQAFARLGLHTLGDLVFFFPRDYQDWRKVTPIGQAKIGETVLIRGQIVESKMQPTRSRLTIIKAYIRDASGVLPAVWFNQQYLEKALRPGREILVMGRMDNRFNELQLAVQDFYFADDHAQVERIIPIYHATEGLTQKFLAAAVEQAFARCGNLVAEILPQGLLDKYSWLPRAEAIRQLHFPTDFVTKERARRRMAYEEFLVIQLAIIANAAAHTAESSELVRTEQDDEDILRRFYQSLPYQLTEAQNRVIREIFADMNGSRPMSRLIQGDVGCGKTAVAAVAVLKCCLGGRQSALMAPTEILARQHMQGLAPLMMGFGVNTALLTGQTTAKEKKKIIGQLAAGEIDFVIGTHALIEDGIRFAKPGLVITDEQHRFGVLQRAKLSGLGADTLVMTATPIPRTLALTVYADLAISVIDQLPPSRKKVETYAVNYSYEQRIYSFIEKELVKGRQTFVVCPLIEESDKLDLASVTACYEKMGKEFPHRRIGLLHGKMKAADKEAVMSGFQLGNIDILVSTTVIEVGVNIPNASVMLIRDAERFGLAQLHQLRGRIGRGAEQSYCLLLHNAVSEQAQERMRIIVASSDGFELAEADLQQRGPGEFFGKRQHGLPELKIASIFNDADLLQQSRDDARVMLAESAQLPDALAAEVRQKWDCLSAI